MKINDVSCFQINLNHRQDRWESAVQNRKKFGYEERIFRKYEAISESFGGLGCAKSHLNALTELYARSKSKYLIVLEDDFRFSVTQEELENRLSEFFESNVNWDVVILNGTLVNIKSNKVRSLRQIFECHSGAGYIVRREYAPRVMEVFLKSVEYLELYKGANEKIIKSYLHSKFAIDVMWKQLQWKDKWFIGDPSFGCTEASHSDIENTLMDQEKITFIKT